MENENEETNLYGEEEEDVKKAMEEELLEECMRTLDKGVD